MKLKHLMDEVSGAVAHGAAACRMLIVDMQAREIADTERANVEEKNALAMVAGLRSALTAQLDTAQEGIRRHFADLRSTIHSTSSLYQSTVGGIVETLDRVRAEHLDGSDDPPPAPLQIEAPPIVEGFEGLTPTEVIIDEPQAEPFIHPEESEAEPRRNRRHDR